MVEARLPAVLVALCGLVFAAAVACTSGPPERISIPTPTTAPAPTSTPLLASSAPPTAASESTAPPTAWDAKAVVERADAFWGIPCPAAADPARANPGQVFSIDTPAAKSCVIAAMRTSNSTPEARDFLERYEVFLTSFAEHGRVDLGTTAAGWVNMGRPEPVFVNSRPALLPLNTLVNGDAPDNLARQWLAHPNYIAALRGETGVAWPEYATIAPVEDRGGRQRFLASIPVRRCRACETLTQLQVVFEFGASGDYLGWQLREPQPPPAIGTPASSR